MMQRRSKIPENVREKVLARSDYQCSICGRTSDLELAHLIPVVEGGDNSFENLMAVCRSCHFVLDSNPTTSIEELKRQRSISYQFERSVGDIFGHLGFAVMGGATGPDGVWT